MSRRNAKSINSRISSKEIPLGSHAHATESMVCGERMRQATQQIKLPHLSKSQSKWRWALKKCYWRSQLGYFIHFKSVLGTPQGPIFCHQTYMMQEVKAVEGLLLLLAYWKMFFLGFPLNFRDRVVPQDGSGWTILHGSKFRTAKLHGQGAYTCERTRPFTRGNSDAGSWVEVLRKVRWNQQPLKLSWLRKQMIWGIPFFEHVPMWRTEPTLPSCFAIGRSGGIIHSNMADMWQLALYTLW